MGGFEVSALAGMEPSLGYHPYCSEILTRTLKQGREHCQAGSLTGAVASKNVTEACKGSLSSVGIERRVQWHKGA